MPQEQGPGSKMYRLASLFVALCAVSPSLSFASSCRDAVVQRIEFAPGAVCWTYTGSATHFSGRFARGQRLSVRMRGELNEFDERTKTIVARWAAREPELRGPGNFFAETRIPGSGVLEITVPVSGQYEIGFYPCAMWHFPGEVEICASALPAR